MKLLMDQQAIMSAVVAPGKRTLRIITPAGEFTRTTHTPYTHAVVRNSPRAMREYLGSKAPDANVYRSGVTGRWIKDRGHGVTWHMSEAAARRAAASPYQWDAQASLVGVFEVLK